MRVLRSTDSLKCNSNTPVLRSKSNDSRSGGIVSPITSLAGRAFDDGIGILGLFDVSTTAPASSDKYVSLTVVPRLLVALIISKSFGASITSISLVFSEDNALLVNITEGFPTVAFP